MIGVMHLKHQLLDSHKPVRMLLASLLEQLQEARPKILQIVRILSSLTKPLQDGLQIQFERLTITEQSRLNQIRPISTRSCGLLKKYVSSAFVTLGQSVRAFSRVSRKERVMRKASVPK